MPVIETKLDTRDATFAKNRDAMNRGERLVIATPEAEFSATVVRRGEERHVFCHGQQSTLSLVDPLAHAGEEEAHGGHLMAPMSGVIVAVMSW